MKTIIFYFSGTGNCLKVAMAIAKELGNTEIVSMGKTGNYTLSKEYDSIGFVYPTYYWGLPKKVIEFIENMNPANNKNAYYYSITTCGGNAVNAVYHIYELMLKRHGIKINYGEKLKMFSNYVNLYEMKANADEITRKSDEKLVPIIDSIKNKKNNKISRRTGILKFGNTIFIKTVSNKDRHYNVNNDCTGCGICKKVCPVGNIELVNNRPQFNHNCEQCVACIQYCPQKAINYKKLTQKRRRYTNPDIDYKELSAHNV
jgi:ferredoxin/flavodoxin